MTNDSSKECEEALEQLWELEMENTRIIKDNINLKEQIESFRSLAFVEQPIVKAQEDFIHL